MGIFRFSSFILQTHHPPDLLDHVRCFEVAQGLAQFCSLAEDEHVHVDVHCQQAAALPLLFPHSLSALADSLTSGDDNLHHLIGHLLITLPEVGKRKHI